MTLIELLLALTVASLLIAVGVAYSVPMLGRDRVRNAVYQMQTFAQLARTEAVARNHDCRLLLSTSNRRMMVSDTMGTVTSSDDLVLHDARISGGIEFASPDATAPVTLQDLGSSWYAATFSSDGTVSAGSGAVSIRGSDRFTRLSLFVGGGTRVASWSGSSWSGHGY